MPVSDPDVSRPRLVRDANFLEADRREIATTTSRPASETTGPRGAALEFAPIRRA